MVYSRALLSMVCCGVQDGHMPGVSSLGPAVPLRKYNDSSVIKEAAAYLDCKWLISASALACMAGEASGAVA